VVENRIISKLFKTQSVIKFEKNKTNPFAVLEAYRDVRRRDPTFPRQLAHRWQ
jgi:hypothetical protein